jgi:hypothetical protein
MGCFSEGASLQGRGAFMKILPTSVHSKLWLTFVLILKLNILVKNLIPLFGKTVVNE